MIERYCRKSSKIGTFRIMSKSKTICCGLLHLVYKLKCLKIWTFSTVSEHYLYCIQMNGIILILFNTDFRQVFMSHN